MDIYNKLPDDLKSVYKQDCSICFESKVCKSVCKQCKFEVCNNCISKWLETNYTCPQCRTPLKPKPISPYGAVFNNQYPSGSNVLRFHLRFQSRTGSDDDWDDWE